MAKVIRAGDQHRLSQFRLDSAEPADPVARATAEAERLLAEAADQAAALRTRAETEGRSNVEQEIERRVEQQIASFRSVLAAATEELAQTRREWQARWEQHAVGLGQAIARRILRRELQADPDIPLTLVREALQLAAGADRLRLLMNTADVDTLGRPVRKLLDELMPAGTAELIADAAISPGGCRVETEHGAIDQQFETQLKRITEELS